MKGLVIAVNEFASVIAMYEFGRRTSSPVPLLLAYAALDGCTDEYYSGYHVKTHCCIAGHRLVLVSGSKIGTECDQFFQALETALNMEIISPFSDDRTWLTPEFHSKIASLCQIHFIDNMAL